MNKKYYIIPIFVPHKGCPHDCVFCNQKKITGIERDIDAEYVYKQVDEYLKTIDRENSYVEVSFYGGSFTGIPIDYQNELLSAANNIFLEGKIDAIRLSTRPDYINQFILDNIKKHNVKVIELGVQSLDEEVLLASERGHTVEDVYKAVSLIKSYGFKLGLQMMIGLPKDNLEKDIVTAKKIIQLNPDFVRIYPALIIKDTYMQFMFQNGIYTPLSIDEAVYISKKVYLLFLKNDIPVIRIGLQASEGINVGKDVVAGPFHPAFRELVESSILIEMIEFILKTYFMGYNDIKIKISNKYISKLYADKKKYFNNLIDMFKHMKFKVIVDDSLEKEYISIESGSFSRKMSIKDYAKITN